MPRGKTYTSQQIAAMENGTPSERKKAATFCRERRIKSPGQRKADKLRQQRKQPK